ncbi:putative bifunctional diguanylate cyclase/phosphodiesterase [Undibacterium arcticum]|uniref:Bifunctional diguanylate cyclase/phosphodiesterase n=1 Tax=Undibacterium arcticum TaxID=1762892 RepID=A0ABV7F2F2_9BURK
MAPITAPEDLACSAELYDAVCNLEGGALDEALGRIVRNLLESPQGGYFQGRLPDSAMLAESVVHDGQSYGGYAVSGRSGGYNWGDRMRLAALARLTGRLLRARVESERRAREFDLIAAQLRQQAQILDQIQESVITMDLAGFIASWNKGAERLFGYAADEAVGRNILFLYEDQDDPDDGSAQFDSHFLQQGSREIEVRRRKKSGEVFWASLSLSPLCDGVGQPVGLIGYLNDITQRKDAEQRIHHLAYYDALTGLPNRTLLMKLVDQGLAVAQRRQTRASILFVDLNRFKPINDTLGHDAGDRLLQQIAARFRSALRDEDVVARLGSDEFAIGLFDSSEPLQTSHVAQKLLNLLDAPFSIDGHELRVGASIGISVYPQDGSDSATLLRLADIAMVRAKQGGDGSGGGYAFYSQAMNQRALHRLGIETGLRRAIAHDELLLLYQPKLDLLSGAIVGAEALLRWQHPAQGLILPAEFIPVAEETGLVVRVGEWVLEAACAQARQWQQAGIAPLRISINVSAREFTSALPERVRDMLARYGLAAHWLELEITESMLMHGVDNIIGIMDQISAMGVALSLDDFGTGYSSLSYLKRFPIDSLKIDRSFIMGIPDDGNDCAIAGTIISIARQLKHKVIAEGVENREQLAFLRKAGCDEMQGYLFSQPVMAIEFENMLREGRRLAL